MSAVPTSVHVPNSRDALDLWFSKVDFLLDEVDQGLQRRRPSKRSTNAVDEALDAGKVRWADDGALEQV